MTFNIKCFTLAEIIMENGIKIFYGELNLAKAQKPYKGKKGGKYIKAVIVMRDTPDEFGNILSVRQQTEYGEDKIFLGNFHEFVKGVDNQKHTVCSKLDKLVECEEN